MTSPLLSPLLRRLGLTRPIVQAPMAGGPATPELVAAVSGAGALGSLGAAYLTPTQIREAGAAIRQRTSRPFAVNLFAPQPLPPCSAGALSAALAELAPLHAELGLAPPSLPGSVQEDFAAQWAAVLDLRPAVFSFAFGRVDGEALAELRGHGILSIGTATSVAEAQQLAEDGVDAVVLQGGAAGGHRGGWQQDAHAPVAGLLSETRRVVNRPLIAAGGLMTRGDVRAALEQGASLAQCGTAFLRAHEAGTSALYRRALADAGAGDTVLTRSFSGREARGLRNAVTERLVCPLPYPYQNALTRPLRAEAARQGRAEFLNLWAGEGVAQGREGSAAELLDQLWP